MDISLEAASFDLPSGLLTAGSLVLDVGGEGRHPLAWNLNQRSERSGASRAFGPIPRLILARADAMPLPDDCVDLLIVERTPLREPTLRELLRVIKPAGVILLRHAVTPAGDPHRMALRLLPGDAQRRVFAHRVVQIQETIIRLGRCGGRRC